MCKILHQAEDLKSPLFLEMSHYIYVNSVSTLLICALLFIVFIVEDNSETVIQVAICISLASPK